MVDDKPIINDNFLFDALIKKLRSVDYVDLSQTDLLVFRLGTDDVPAGRESIEAFELEISLLLRRLKVDIQFMVVSSLVRVVAVGHDRKESLEKQHQQAMELIDKYGIEEVIKILNRGSKSNLEGFSRATIDFNDPYGTAVIVDIKEGVIYHSPASNEKIYQKLKKMWAENADLYSLQFPMTPERVLYDDWSFVERSLDEMLSTRDPEKP